MKHHRPGSHNYLQIPNSSSRTSTSSWVKIDTSTTSTSLAWAFKEFIFWRSQISCKSWTATSYPSTWAIMASDRMTNWCWTSLMHSILKMRVWKQKHMSLACRSWRSRVSTKRKVKNWRGLPSRSLNDRVGAKTNSSRPKWYWCSNADRWTATDTIWISSWSQGLVTHKDFKIKCILQSWT